MEARAGSPAQAATIARLALPVMREMWTAPRRPASADTSAVSETSCHMRGLDRRRHHWRHTLTRVDQTIVAGIRTWQNFPARSGLRRALAKVAVRAGACADRVRQRRALAALDDRLLRDIGVTARDAAQETGKPFWR